MNNAINRRLAQHRSRTVAVLAGCGVLPAVLEPNSIILEVDIVLVIDTHLETERRSLARREVRARALAVSVGAACVPGVAGMDTVGVGATDRSSSAE